MANRPKICGNCGKLMGIDDDCPYCGVSRHDVRQIKGYLRKVSGSSFSAMKFLFAMNIVLYVGPILFWIIYSGSLSGLSMFWSGPPYAQIFSRAIYSSPILRDGYFWGLFTANFLHLNLLHLLFNSYALYILSPQLEDELGAIDFFNFYVLAGVGGFTFSALAGNVSGGASSAIFGLIAAHIFLPLARGDHHRSPMFQVAIQWAVFSFVFGFIVGADSYAHGGGFFFGGLLSYVFALLQPTPVWKKLRTPLAIILLSMVVFGFARPFF